MHNEIKVYVPWKLSKYYVCMNLNMQWTIHVCPVWSSRAATAGKAPKTRALSRFWVSIRFKKNPVKKIGVDYWILPGSNSPLRPRAGYHEIKTLNCSDYNQVVIVWLAGQQWLHCCLQQMVVEFMPSITSWFSLKVFTCMKGCAWNCGNISETLIFIIFLLPEWPVF